MKTRNAVGVAAGSAIFLLALYELRHTLARYDVRQVRSDLAQIPASDVLAAVGFTACGYLMLILYHALAQRYVGREMPAQRTAFVGFVSYAISNALGFPLLLGGGVRYRLYNAWGLSSAEIALIVGFISTSFWLGVLAVAGTTLLIEPRATPQLLGISLSSLRPLGALMLLGIAGYLLASVLRQKPMRLFGWEVSVPRPRLALMQVVVASVEWVFAAAALWTLLPARVPGLSFAVFLSAFVLGNAAGVVSHVPGGLGVFEWILLGLLGDYVPASSLIGVVIVYRVVYYLLPLGLAATMLTVNELLRGKTGFARAARAAGAWAPGVAPTVLSITTFIGGTLLLFSGATPAVPGRLRLVAGFVPLAVIESSHFVGSLAGAALLVFSRGLGRRLDAAYYLAVGALGIGILASLLKGFDYEEAIALTVILAALAPARRHFYRRASLTSELFTPAWVFMTLVALGTSVSLGVFAYKHVDYSADLWWHFALRGDAPRFLRATVGATAVLFLVALQRLLRPAAADPAPPDDATIERVRQIVRTSTDTSAQLALLGDKSFLFSDDGNAFVMYGVEGRSFVAMGDPLGPPRERQELAWRFRELADRHGAWTVFYQVRMHNLPLYLDLGLTLLKLGEEGRVSLAGFSLEGGARKGMRRVVKNLEREGCTFEIVPETLVPPLLPRLRAISDAWLASKRTREKAFSLGYFDERYLRCAPVAVVKRGAEIVAFANLWPGAGHEELSVDLMRYVDDAPEGVMDYLFIELLLWGRREGYAHFNLGMAPLSGLENRQLAPIWNRVGALLFRHAENFYNFQGLRAYKQKFDPVWEPRYLASPGGLALPRILTNVSALVSGGLRGVLTK
ncbi:MAG: bifunctional lysylphosphatidylglycerol flippase/synthetase MprF [Gemmatimonadales bacterium]